jgi:hypothetical protein
MDSAIVNILDSCIGQLEAGVPLEECLAGYPQQRAELEGPLLIATSLRQLPRPALPAATRASLETQMLARAAARRAAPSPNGRHAASSARGPVALLDSLPRRLGYRGATRPWMRLASIAIAVLLALTLGAGAFAAARALVRIIAPSARPTPTSAPTNTTGAIGLFTRDGIIVQIGQEGWVVVSETIAINAQTTISGPAQIGEIAHVRGIAQADGTLLAVQITVEPPKPTPATPLPKPMTATPLPATATPVLPSATPVAPVQEPPGDKPSEADKQHACQGLQLGRDEKKCDPQPPPPKEKEKPKEKPKKGNKGGH